ncbi:MAG: hypothetical protein C5B59_02385 [Bacteroidetes bacterium]|nr:MAG: hypothetical protein C5B59_02385 [Bacteroidota bacterium]
MKKIYTLAVSLLLLAFLSSSCNKENMKAPENKKTQSSTQQDKTGSGTAEASNPNATPSDQPPTHPTCPGH